MGVVIGGDLSNATPFCCAPISLRSGELVLSWRGTFCLVLFLWFVTDLPWVVLIVRLTNNDILIARSGVTTRSR